MNNPPDFIRKEWKYIIENKNFSLVEKSLRLAKLLDYPHLNIQEFQKKLNKIGMELSESVSQKKSPEYLISFLNEFMFKKLGFQGDENDYFNPKNNFLNEVVDKKTGIPITLAIIYVELAKYLGLELRIVGFPGHVLVKYNEEYVLDPFYGGRLLSIDELQELLDRNFDGHLEFSPEFLNEISNGEILLRMLRNLKNSYMQSFAYDKALLCTNLILEIEPHSFVEIRDKGILEERLGNYQQSLQDLTKYLELNPNGDDIDFILDLIKDIRSKINQ